jgi:SP family sugar:H+ symporter-like MFS transporter
MTVFVMSVWAICCVPIMITSKSRSQFLAARCLNSVYIGMEMAVIPVFQAEIVPAAVRGLAVASYQMAFAFGGFIISGICHRTSEIPNDWAWRTPLLCYLFGEYKLLDRR